MPVDKHGLEEVKLSDLKESVENNGGTDSVAQGTWSYPDDGETAHCQIKGCEKRAEYFIRIPDASFVLCGVHFKKI